MNEKPLGVKIKEIRQRSGINQCELAKIVGVSQSMISQGERSSRQPLPETLKKISSALRCQLEQLKSDPSEYVKLMRSCKSLSHEELVYLNRVVYFLKR